MPLSDREQQILQDIERRLYEQDPEFAREVDAQSLSRREPPSIRTGFLVLLLGFFVLFAGFGYPRFLIPLGVIAFLLMVAGGTLAYQAAKRMGAKQLQVLDQRGSFKDVAGRVEGRIRDMRRRRRDL